MSQDAKALPQSEQLNIAAFSKLFTHTANSYKYLFFLALLNVLNQRQFDPAPIALQDLIVEMLVVGWQGYHPHHLSFGNKDAISGRFDAFVVEVGNELAGDALRQAIAKKMGATIRDLKRFAPYRLIRPFLDNELKGVKSSEANQKIASLSREHFQDKKPLYRFNDKEESITIHSEWEAYLKVNYAIVHDRAIEEWASYMQKCNPKIADLRSKLLTGNES